MSTTDHNVDDDVESDYDVDDIVDVDVDVDESDTVEITNAKHNVDDDEDEEENEHEEDDGNMDSAPKKIHHMYHQIPESTEIRIVPASKRITSEYMTTYEYSIVVGTRATHISNGSVLYTDPDGLFDPRDIAKKEINENMCPLSITRKISPTSIEVWEVNEMIKPQL